VREDLRIVVKYSEDLRHAILHLCNQQGNPNFEVEIPRLKEFRDKYDIRIGRQDPSGHLRSLFSLRSPERPCWSVMRSSALRLARGYYLMYLN
jgi:hypothetical protein